MYHQLKSAFMDLVRDNGLIESEINIKARQLKPIEAIGETERKDFPLLQGKESLIQAEFRGSLGQAFTDMPRSYAGKIKDILDMELRSNGDRAIFISALNAVMRYIENIDKTVHCKNDEPEVCAKNIATNIINRYGININVGIIGFQPAIIDNIAKMIPVEKVMVNDLDINNIGKKKYGVVIWDGKIMKEDIFIRSDVILATGSTIVNNTLESLVNYADKHNKPIYFYGTTIAGPANILNLNRLCPMAS